MRVTVGKGKEKSVSAIPELPPSIVAPVKKGQVVAKILVQNEGKTVKEVPSPGLFGCGKEPDSSLARSGGNPCRALPRSALGWLLVDSANAGEEVWMMKSIRDVTRANHPDVAKGDRFPMVLKEIVQTEKEIEASLDRICEQLLDRHPQLNEMVLVGIRTGGVFLAERLKEKILRKKGSRPSDGDHRHYSLPG